MQKPFVRTPLFLYLFVFARARLTSIGVWVSSEYNAKELQKNTKKTTSRAHTCILFAFYCNVSLGRQRIAQSPNRQIAQIAKSASRVIAIAQSPNCQIAQSPNRQIAQSPNRPNAQSHHRQTAKSSNRPMAQSPDRPMAKSPNRPIATKSPNRPIAHSPNRPIAQYSTEVGSRQSLCRRGPYRVRSKSEPQNTSPSSEEQTHGWGPSQVR